tara:strand:+ start:1510 stop:1776 length:267 start_codon:yes stop_codon:yes gene_type:complete
MDQKIFDNLKPGDLVAFKHKKETIGLVTRSRKKGRPWNPFSRYVEYIEVTIDWRDEDGSFIGMYASDDNPSLEQLHIIVKAKNDRKYF